MHIFNSLPFLIYQGPFIERIGCNEEAPVISLAVSDIIEEDPKQLHSLFLLSLTGGVGIGFPYTQRWHLQATHEEGAEATLDPRIRDRDGEPQRLIQGAQGEDRQWAITSLFTLHAFFLGGNVVT